MKNIVIPLLFAALILRLSLFIAITHNDPSRFIQSDSGGYLKIASNMLSHGIISSSPEAPFLPEHIRTPLYPMYISVFKAFGLGVKSIIISQIFISLATLCLAVFLCVNCFGLSKLAAFTAGGILALDVPTIVLSNSLLTETLFTFLLLSAIYFLIRYLKSPSFKLLSISGMLLGLCTLCRPTTFMFPVFLLLWLFPFRKLFAKKFLYSAFAFLVTFAIVIAPWLIRNKLIFGAPFVSSIGNYILLYYEAPAVLSVINNISFEESSKKLVSEFEGQYPGLINSGNLVLLGKLEKKAALKVFISHPVAFAKVYLRAICSMLLRPMRNDIDLMLGFASENNTLGPLANNETGSLLTRFINQTSTLTVILCILQIIILIPSYLLALAGTVTGIKTTRPEVLVIAISVLYLCLMSWAPDSYARFRVPIMPFIAILAATGVQNLRLKGINEKSAVLS